MEGFGGTIVVLVLVVVVALVVPRLVGGGSITCNRCDGTGKIDERWPDPKEPTGFHTATGTCPKCKGKGKIKA